MGRSKPMGRHRPKARTGCWSCKRRKVKCSEELPKCRACVRLGLACEYSLRLKWSSPNEFMEDEEVLHVSRSHQLSGTLGPPQAPAEKRGRGQNWHFIHFGLQDFDGDCVDLDPEDMEFLDTPQPPLTDPSPLTNWLLSSPESECPSLVYEPSWFPPLEQSSSLDEVLFMYYALEIINKCTMYDDSANGFRTIVIPMSVNNPAVMHSILAVAALYQQNVDPSYRILAMEQKEKALVHVRRCFTSDTHQDYIQEELITTAIMLCVFEIKDGSGPNWNKHLEGGRSILRSKVPGRGSHSWGTGIAWWANKFFAYQAVNGAASSLAEDPQTEILAVPELWLSQGLEIQEIDGFMGCSSELMALTAEVIAAARRYQIHPGKERSSTSYLGSLERRLHMVVQSCSHISLILSESSPLGSLIESFLVQPEVLVRSKILALTAEARRQASLLLLYVGVRGFCTSRTEVRVRVANCLLCLSAVSQLMPAEDAPLWGMTPIIWPLFMAGSCVTTESQRIQVMEMFENLKRSKCLGNVQRALHVIKSMWKRNDTTQLSASYLETWKLYMDPESKWPLSLG